MPETTKRVRFTETRHFYVEVDADTADAMTATHEETKPYGNPALGTYSYTVHDGAEEMYDRYVDLQRASHHLGHHIVADLTVRVIEDGEPWDDAEPFIAEGAEGGYIWSARHYVGKARHELIAGRYREGHCPDLDAVAGDLARVEERLRLMALEVDKARCHAPSRAVLVPEDPA